MSSPIPLTIYIILYLRFIYIDGVRFMRDRKPYDLTTFIRYYNVFQVIACTFFAKMLSDVGIKVYEAWTCIDGFIADDGLYYTWWSWWFVGLRAIEFSETVTFVLRKKTKQISFLHVYHHISTLLVTWAYVRTSPGNKVYFYFKIINLIRILYFYKQLKPIYMSHQSTVLYI